MNVIFIGGPRAGTVTSAGDAVTSIGPIGNGTYIRSGGVDALGRTEFRYVENQDPNAEERLTKLVNDNPPPLNPPLPWPYKIDPFPAAAIFGTPYAAPRIPLAEPPKNPNRKE